MNQSTSLEERDYQLVMLGYREHFSLLNRQTGAWKEGDKLLNDTVLLQEEVNYKPSLESMCARCNVGNDAQLII